MICPNCSKILEAIKSNGTRFTYKCLEEKCLIRVEANIETNIIYLIYLKLPSNEWIRYNHSSREWILEHSKLELVNGSYLPLTKLILLSHSQEVLTTNFNEYITPIIEKANLLNFFE